MYSWNAALMVGDVGRLEAHYNPTCRILLASNIQVGWHHTQSNNQDKREKIVREHLSLVQGIYTIMGAINHDRHQVPWWEGSCMLEIPNSHLSIWSNIIGLCDEHSILALQMPFLVWIIPDRQDGVMLFTWGSGPLLCMACTSLLRFKLDRSRQKLCRYLQNAPKIFQCNSNYPS